MAVQFPQALDTFVNPTPAVLRSSSMPPHSQQHADANDAIEALEAKVGIDGSADPDSLDYRLSRLEAVFTTVTGNHSVVSSDRIILCNASGGALTIMLPDAEDSANRVLIIKKIDASENFVTIEGDDPIDGLSERILPVQWDAMKLGCDGLAWFILP